MGTKRTSFHAHMEEQSEVKQYAKELIAFVEKNAKEIKKCDRDTQERMMQYEAQCVLRPWKIPYKITKRMSDSDIVKYNHLAYHFQDASDINKAVQAVKDWCKK